MSLDVVVRLRALVFMSNKFKNFNALIVKLSSSPLSSKSLSGMQSGMFSLTYTTASVTSSVFDGLCKNAASINETYDATPRAGGDKSSYSNSSSHGGRSCPKVPVLLMPKNCGGKFIGQLHCCGTIQHCAFGYLR